VFSSLALAAVVAHPWGPGPGWLFFLVPLFWIGVIVLLAVIFGRRRRAMWAQGGPWGGPGAWHHVAGSAEATLAQRYANGDIDEKEYRARLEVLRSTPPVPPVK